MSKILFGGRLKHVYNFLKEKQILKNIYKQNASSLKTVLVADDK